MGHTPQHKARLIQEYCNRVYNPDDDDRIDGLSIQQWERGYMALKNGGEEGFTNYLREYKWWGRWFIRFTFWWAVRSQDKFNYKRMWADIDARLAEQRRKTQERRNRETIENSRRRWAMVREMQEMGYYERVPYHRGLTYDEILAERYEEERREEERRIAKKNKPSNFLPFLAGAIAGYAFVKSLNQKK